VGVGIVLRLVRYAANHSLWGDEAALAVNLIRLPFSALLEPLLYHQGAPPLFLLAEKWVVTRFGFGEQALRLLPFLASCASLPLFALLARRVLSRGAAAVALLLFAVNDPLVFYAAQVKQYSTDVLCAILVALPALGILTGRATRSALVLFPFLAASLVWLSNAIPFVAAAAVAAMVVPAAGEGRPPRVYPLLAALPILGSGFLVFRLGRSLYADEYILASWSKFFLPIPPGSLQDLLWLPSKLLAYFNNPGGFLPAWPAALLFLLGCGFLARRRPGVTSFLFFLLGLLLAASALHLYPFTTTWELSARDRIYPYLGRLLLFTLPFTLLAVGEGIHRAWNLAEARFRCPAAVVALAVAVPLVCQAAYNAASPPRIHELRPLMERIRTVARSDEPFLVHRMTTPIFEYYTYVFRMPAGVREISMRGPADAADLQRLVESLKPGQRFWLVAVYHHNWGSETEIPYLATAILSRADFVTQLDDWNASAVLFVVRDRAREATPPQG
jgi:hypothetical protein